MSKLLVLSEWEKHIKDFDIKLSTFTDVTMIALESPHIEASFRLTEHYTSVVADSVDLPVDLLMDWWLEYKFGEAPMKVYIKDELFAEVSTLVELLHVWEKVK